VDLRLRLDEVTNAFSDQIREGLDTEIIGWPGVVWGRATGVLFSLRASARRPEQLGYVHQIVAGDAPTRIELPRDLGGACCFREASSPARA
jgi:hypothetical protein